MSNNLERYNQYLINILNMESNEDYSDKLKDLLNRFVDKKILEDYNKFLVDILRSETGYDYSHKLKFSLDKF